MLKAQPQVLWVDVPLAPFQEKIKNSKPAPSQEHKDQIISEKLSQEFLNPFAFMSASPPDQSWCFTALPGPQTPQPGQPLPHPSGTSTLLACHTQHTVPKGRSRTPNTPLFLFFFLLQIPDFTSAQAPASQSIAAHANL